MKWKNHKQWLAFASGIASLLGSTADAVELKSETASAFDRYVHATERRMEDDLRGGRFLVIDTLPESAREQVYAELKRGQFYIAPLRSQEKGKPIPVPGGLIHHWVGVAFIPGATLSQTLAVLQDYDNHKTIYKPDVLDSKLLSRNGNDFKVFLQFYRKSLVTVVVNVNLDIQYSLLGTARATSKSYSTRISEVENAGQPDEHELPVGKDHGYLWRLYSYSRIEEKDGGTYIQVESVGLSRTIPWAIAWLVDPLTRSIPRNVLSGLLDSTRRAVQSNAEPHTHSGLSEVRNRAVLVHFLGAQAIPRLQKAKEPTNCAMPLRNMMRRVLSVMPDRRHASSRFARKGPASTSPQHFHTFPTSHVGTVLSATRANGSRHQGRKTRLTR